MKFEAIVSPSLKDLFVNQIENMILQGEFKIGQQLPIERDLAAQMKVSRSIVNNGMQELADKGFVKIIPRKGTFIEDYVRNGNIKTLSAIMSHKGSKFDKVLLDSFIEFRRDLETLCTKKASFNRTEQQASELRVSVDFLRQAIGQDNFLDDLINLHKLIYIATNNLVYPLLFNAFYEVLHQVTKTLLPLIDNEIIVNNMEAVVTSIIKGNEENAYMAMLTHVDECALALKQHYLI